MYVASRAVYVPIGLQSQLRSLAPSNMIVKTHTLVSYRNGAHRFGWTYRIASAHTRSSQFVETDPGDRVRLRPYRGLSRHTHIGTSICDRIWTEGQTVTPAIDKSWTDRIHAQQFVSERIDLYPNLIVQRKPMISYKKQSVAFETEWPRKTDKCRTLKKY